MTRFQKKKKKKSYVFDFYNNTCVSIKGIDSFQVDKKKKKCLKFEILFFILLIEISRND
jgi:hypothetical protein